MKLLDSMIRRLILSKGTGLRWLRAELEGRQVSIPVTDACLSELVRDADVALRRDGADQGARYVERLRKQIARHADFIQRWTGSDEEPVVAASDATVQSLVRIARKHALPRRWKLSDPIVVEYRRKRPSYRQWTDDLDPAALSTP